MSNRIELTLSPSQLAGILASLPWLVLSAFLVVTALAGKTWLLTALPVALAGATLQYRGHGLLRGNRSVNGLLVDQEQMYAITGDNRRIPVSPASSSRIWSSLVLLKLHPSDTRSPPYTTILLAPLPGSQGNVAEDDFRRLRVWLRLGRSGRPST